LLPIALRKTKTTIFFSPKKKEKKEEKKDMQVKSNGAAAVKVFWKNTLFFSEALRKKRKIFSKTRRA